MAMSRSSRARRFAEFFDHAETTDSGAERSLLFIIFYPSLKKLLRATQVNVRKPFGAGGYCYAPDRLARTRSAPFSPIMMVVALVLPPMMDGITEASITRRLSTPRTWSSGSTTESSSDAHRAGPDRVVLGL